jgi:hypothetical protein
LERLSGAQHDYLISLWATADSRETLVSGDVTIASLLKLPESEAGTR